MELEQQYEICDFSYATYLILHQTASSFSKIIWKKEMQINLFGLQAQAEKSFYATTNVTLK